MNSMLKNNYESCEKEEIREEKHCSTIIKCGFPNSTLIPNITGTSINRTFTVTSLNLDTSYLCDPNIKLEFVSNITVGAGTFTGAISFQVFKQCRHQVTPVPVGPSWIFAANGLTAGSASTFTFFVCDSDSCFDKCCKYTVEARIISVTANTSIIPVPAPSTLNVNNATLGAITTCKGNKCNRKFHEKHDEKY